MNCPNCHATPGAKHAWGCPNAPQVSSAAADRMAQQQHDFAFAAAVNEEHF